MLKKVKHIFNETNTILMLSFQSAILVVMVISTCGVLLLTRGDKVGLIYYFVIKIRICNVVMNQMLMEQH